jgi:hypothetical protein
VFYDLAPFDENKYSYSKGSIITGRKHSIIKGRLKLGMKNFPQKSPLLNVLYF